ncbi:MAG: 2-oxoacid:acceptor oxidoreductase family protein [Bilophila wadsworthia]
MLVKCMFSGSGGQGSALMAKLVCEGAMRENLKVVMTQTYGIEQRGGDSTAFIIISDEAIGSPIVENDATIAVALVVIYEQCLRRGSTACCLQRLAGGESGHGRRLTRPFARLNRRGSGIGTQRQY